MQAIPRKIHGLRCLGSVQPGQYILDIFDQVGPDSATIIAFVEPFQTAMLEASDRPVYTVKCTLSLVTLSGRAPYTVAACSSRAISAMIAAASSSSEDLMDW